MFFLTCCPAEWKWISYECICLTWLEWRCFIRRGVHFNGSQEKKSKLTSMLIQPFMKPFSRRWVRAASRGFWWQLANTPQLRCLCHIFSCLPSNSHFPEAHSWKKLDGKTLWKHLLMTVIPRVGWVEGQSGGCVDPCSDPFPYFHVFIGLRPSYRKHWASYVERGGCSGGMERGLSDAILTGKPCRPIFNSCDTTWLMGFLDPPDNAPAQNRACFTW